MRGKNDKRNIYFLFQFILLLVLCINSCYSINVYISNNFDSIKNNFRSVIDSNLSRNDVTVNFDSSYYDFVCDANYNIHIKHTLTFQSKKGSKIDYSGRNVGTFFINFGLKDVDKKFIVKNLTFANFDNKGNRYGNLFVFETIDKDNR